MRKTARKPAPETGGISTLLAAVAVFHGAEATAAHK